MTAPDASPYDDGVVPSATDLWSVDPTGVARDWLADHEPLSRDALAAVGVAFRDAVGAPAELDDGSGLLRDDALRTADAAAFGRFAHDHDVAILEPADGAVDPTLGYCFGYTPDADSPDDTGVPLLVCLPGPLTDAVAWLEAFSETVASMPGLGIVRL